MSDVPDAGDGSAFVSVGEPRGVRSSVAGCEETTEVCPQQTQVGQASVGADGADVVGRASDHASMGDFADMTASTSRPPVGRQRRLETPLQREHRLARQRDYNRRRRRGTVMAETSDDHVVESLRETETQYSARLERQREYNQRRRQTRPNGTSGQENEYNAVCEAPDMPRERVVEQHDAVETTEQRRSRLAQQSEYRERQREYRELQRLDETPDQRSDRLAQQREYRVLQRLDEPPDQRSDRLAQQREYRELQRFDETPEQRRDRLAQQREYRALQRLDETPEQRHSRLAEQRYYREHQRLDATPEQRSDQRAQQSAYRERRRLEETPDQQSHRLAQTRERSKRKRHDETLEQRDNRLAQQRIHHEGQRLDETPQRRHDRLAQQRGYRESQRLGETPEQRRIRLAALAAYNYRQRQSSSVLSSVPTLSAVPLSTIAKIQNRLHDALGAEGLDEHVCAVCDRLVLRKEILVVTGDSSVFAAMKSRLVAPTDLPPLLAAHYACDHIHVSLRKLLLSSKGVRGVPPDVELAVCEECFVSLSKNSSEPPKFSIANGFYIGRLPEHLVDATWIETIMTQLVTVVAQTRVMRGGRHRAIRSHCMVFDATPGPPATLLPRRVDRNGPYSIVLAGPMTTSQTDTIRKLHRARGQIVRELLEFYISHNRYYDGVEVSSVRLDAVDTDESICDRVSIVHEDAETTAAIDDEQSSPTDDATGVEGECEGDVIERNILLAPQDVVPDVSFVQRVVDLNPHEPATAPRLQVNHSSRYASTRNVEAKMYPHLFPFGRGHPDEPRRVHVSKRACLRHYAMLSSRRFAQDPTFMMTAFARLSLENMYMLTSVKCKRNGSLFQGFETLTQDDLAAVLINNERRQRGERQREDVNPNAARFMKSVELASVSVWGSSAERRQCRQEAFGYQTRFGQPSLFVTLTPNADNSYAMAHYTGILSVATLFDALEARIPSAATMKKAALSDDCASARLFMRTVDAFIAHVLGVDPKTQVSEQEGGRFGRTKAYFGMVETQGRGTLHIHFLIWLYGAPINSQDFEANVRAHGEAYERGLEEYTGSIVTNELPLPINDAHCQKCNAAGEFLPLPIPPKARKQRNQRSSDAHVEPLLVECGSCGQQSSAQHLIRQLLLQHRPQHWPPPLEPLSDDEAKRRVDKELQARSSSVEASRLFREREIFLSSLEASEADGIARWLLEMEDAPQLPYRRTGEGAVHSDTMSRMIEMMPPSPDLARMSPKHRAYMLTSLVAKFNMHSWSHTGSCFKKSRSTASSSSCRYGFPRKRAVDVSLSGASVTIPRSLGHEYINGYNATIMEAFKCNHDIQVLFGGKDAVNRIYYCCKYVTKSQRQIDSSTAVALASFQRRQTREEVEALTDTPPTLIDVRRRRVTSMVYTFTNKQEIAGPLAALYLLRGSCCYSSANCVKLPLPDVLRQLEGNGDYTCTLVQSASNQESVYKSTSHLDDYIYRPLDTEDSSLYEYTMRCYRRPIGGTTSASHRFSDLHPLSASHCIAFRRTEYVPVISGPRLPRLKDEMDSDERERYAKIALVLFKPFRATRDLLGSHVGVALPWYSAFCEWEPTCSAFVKSILTNMQDFHAGRESESETVVDEGDDCSSSDCGSSEDGYVSGDLEDNDDDARDDFNVFSLFDGDVDAGSEGRPLQMFPTPAAFPPRIQDVLAEFNKHRLVGGMAEQVAGMHMRGSTETSLEGMSVEDLKRWVDDATTDSAQNSTSGRSNTALGERLERDTTVDEIIDRSLQPDQLQWEQVLPTTSPPVASMYCGIAEMSRHFTLNKLQHGAFAMVGTHLLRRWRSAPADSQELNTLISDAELSSRQLLMFLGGEGGTGKSRVIGAVQELCRSWCRPDALVVTALTGKAASLIDGRTLASFEMSLKGSDSHAAVQTVDCLIVDEVSMMSKDQLLKLDRLLRKAKRVKSVPFGGVYIILVGDFLQLPPVGADPLFTDPVKKKKASLTDLEGYELWRLFDKVVVLRDSVRFKEDPSWGEGCSKARYGEWTPEFIAMINAQLVDEVSVTDTLPGTANTLGTVFVTPDNDTRSAINGHFIARTASFLPSEQYPIRVIANFKGTLNNLSIEDVKHVMGLPDTKFGRMAPYLDLIRGMPVQITQNVRTKKGVANGTMGFLESVRFPDDTSFRRALDIRTGTVVLLPDKSPLLALVSLHRGSAASPIQEGADSSLFPVFPDAEAYTKATIPLTSVAGDSRTLSVKIQQFPFVCAVGATVYKVQGESLKSMAVVDWKVSLRGANRPQQAYLMVSRVVKRSGLICLKPFTTDIATWAKPPADAIEEDRRLGEESERTLERFYASLA